MVDVEPLLTEHDRAIRKQANGSLDSILATKEELLRDTWDGPRRSYGPPLVSRWPGVTRREATAPENPFRHELWRGQNRVAIQYRGVLLGRMNGPALRALTAVWREYFSYGFDRVRGLNLCPFGGFIPWHSNERQTPGWRAYVIVCDRDGESEFRYWSGTDVIRVPDRNGTLNLFSVNSEEPLFWHAVVSNTRRLSCGFRLTAEAAAPLIDRCK